MKLLPLQEFVEIIEIFNRFQEKQNEAQNGSNSGPPSKNKDTKMSGTEVPNAFQ